MNETMDVIKNGKLIIVGEKEEEEPIQTKPISEQITPLVQRQAEEKERLYPTRK